MDQPIPPLPGAERRLKIWRLGRKSQEK
jgi:hypothetical protein